mgnify:CR=1 FL=1
MELTARHAGCSENIAIETAQIDERLSFFDEDTRSRQFPPFFHQRDGYVVLDFVATRADGRPGRHFQIAGPDIGLRLE